MTQRVAWSYQEQAAWIEPIAKALERIAYRLRQGAIDNGLASSKLVTISEVLADYKNHPPLNITAATGTVTTGYIRTAFELGDDELMDSGTFTVTFSSGARSIVYEGIEAYDDDDARDKAIVMLHLDHPEEKDDMDVEVERTLIHKIRPRYWFQGNKTAHISADPSVVSHCVFCGSGAIVARGDGGVECTLCNRSFSVMEQPLYSNMPSTDPGANIETTPFDPLMQEDAFDPGAQAPGKPAPPGDQPPAGPAGAQAPAAGGAGAVPGKAKVTSPAAGSNKPAGGNPFAKGGQLANRNGVPLSEDDFVLHHAIRIARGE